MDSFVHVSLLILKILVLAYCIGAAIFTSREYLPHQEDTQ